MTVPFRVAAAAAVTLLLGTQGQAQSVNCDQAMDQASMTLCAGQDYKAADKKLNAAYSALTRGLPAEDMARLKTAQRSWITYRDRMCDFVGAPSNGGSIHAMVVANCLTAITNAQTDILTTQGTCQEGDVTCVAR